MNIYHLTQNEENGYDTYSDCVVVAKTNKAARNIHPSGDKSHWKDNKWFQDWASNPKNVSAQFIGKAKKGLEGTVICASYHAG